MTSIEKINETIFESIKHINEYGQEYWTARELIPVLQYKEYRFFKKVILKAINACKGSKIKASDHFVHVHDMVSIGSGAQRELADKNKPRHTPRLILINKMISCLILNLS